MEPQPAKEKWFDNELPDPVFEGMVKEFDDFDEALQGISKQIEAFMDGAQQFAAGIHILSDSIATDMMRMEDRRMLSDSYKLRQATHQIALLEAPHSCISKLKRNMDFNILKPIESHLANNMRLKEEFEKRRRRLDELKCACKQMDECTRWELSGTDRRFLMAQQEYETSKSCFDKQDRRVFEWLYVLELHRNDILDSCLQTLKYLQYEFFAASAHALSGALPAHMAFRPMAEMMPECLEAQVDTEIQKNENDLTGVHTGECFSTKLVERLTRDDTGPPPGPVDPLSLSSLLLQGFEEGRARRALRLHRNDTQAALDWLIEGGSGDAPRTAAADEVRTPRTAKHVRRWDLQELRERLRGAKAAPSPTGLGSGAAPLE